MRPASSRCYSICRNYGSFFFMYLLCIWLLFIVWRNKTGFLYSGNSWWGARCSAGGFGAVCHGSVGNALWLPGGGATLTHHWCHHTWATQKSVPWRCIPWLSCVVYHHCHYHHGHSIIITAHPSHPMCVYLWIFLRQIHTMWCGLFSSRSIVAHMKHTHYETASQNTVLPYKFDPHILHHGL